MPSAITQALVERSLVGGAVPEEGNRDPAGLSDLGRKRGADRQRNSCADDAVGAEHSLADVGDVHRAAFTPANACALAEDLRHHRVQVHSLGDRMAVAAVGARHVIAVAEGGADAGGDRFLARVKMEESRHAARLGELVQSLLEAADRAHGAVGFEQAITRELHQRHLLVGNVLLSPLSSPPRNVAKAGTSPTSKRARRRPPLIVDQFRTRDLYTPSLSL
jgi:hypothetical protein